jgi:signal transduction histidine kinase
MAQEIESTRLSIGAPQQKLLDLLQEISLSAVKAETSTAAFHSILKQICEFMAWPLGHVYMWSEETGVLNSSGIWFVGDEGQFDAFRELSERTRFSPGEGTVGRVISTGEAVTVVDVRNDTGFVRQLPIDKGGIRAYFAFPVVTNKRVTAVIEFFSPVSGAPNEDLTSVIYHAGALLGMTLERERAITRLQQRELQLAERVRQLTALIKIGQTVAGTLELPKIYDRVLKLLQPLIEAEVLVLVLYEENELKIAALEQVGVLDIIGTRIPLEGSIAGDSWRDRKSVHLHGEACKQRIFLSLPETADFRPTAIMATPLCVHDDCLGVLVAAHSDEDAFDDDDLILLETAALWTAIAIGNARQYQALHRRLDETKVIVAISNAMVGAVELDQVLQLITESVMETMTHADWTAIHLLGSDGERLELVASAGLLIGQGDYTIAPGEGIAQRVIATGETVNIADVQADPDRLPIDLNTQARSLLVSLVESRQRRLGTISVQCAIPNSFTSEDESLLKVLGIQAGIAIDSARLYAAQRQARLRAEQQSNRIRQMARRVVQAQEEERARISRELHDEAGQSLTALQIGIELAQTQLPDELRETKSSLEELVQLAHDTQTNLRHLSHNLRPPGLDAYGLDAALRGLCEDFARHTGLKVCYEGQEVPDLQPLPALSLYRFAQEALTNVAKHANASSVQVVLEPGSETIILWVEDDGHGFDPPDWEASVLPQGSGLIGMLERLEMVDGYLDISSVEGEGTRLTAVVPQEIDSP